MEPDANSQTGPSQYVFGSVGREGARYLLNGLVCAIINIAILIGGDWAGLGHFNLVFLTWLIGGSIGYGLHNRLTFHGRAMWRRYAQFMAGLALGIPVTFIVIEFFLSFLSLAMWSAAPAATFVMIMYNYLNARSAITGQFFPSPATLNNDDK